MRWLRELLPGLEPGSLRYRALAVVVLIVVLPLLWVWTTGPFEQNLVLSVRRNLRDALEEARTATPGELGAIARRHRVRLRVLAPGGQVIADHDNAARPAVIRAVEDPFFGPGGPPSLTEYDARLPELRLRSLVIGASQTPSARCEVVEEGLLLVCAAAVRRVDGSRVHVMRGSPRLVRSLYDERFQLTAVTLIVLGVGVLVGGWLSWRMVGPIEKLRDQVLARMEGLGGGAASSAPIAIASGDEFGQLAEAFNALLRALDERNRSNAEFAADLAHELKNPVAAVRAAAEAMSGRPVDAVRQQRLQRVLESSASRLELVIGQFLDLARAEAGLPGAPRESVDLRALCDAVVEPYRVDERNAGITFTVRGSSVVVPAVAERLETALHNLLSNAVSFAGADGSITVAIESDVERARLTVQDSGPGVPEDVRDQIFERYVTTREGGTGLGLALTRAIVRAHGGTIEVREPPGGGTAMVAVLPR